MIRILEPELMDDQRQAMAFAQANFSNANQRFIDLFLRIFPHLGDSRIVDLGCGPADIPIRLCKVLPNIMITAVEASEPMIKIAQKAIDVSSLGDRINLVHARFTDINSIGNNFDAVISNSLLHHLSNPLIFWMKIQKLIIPGAPIFVMDLIRPDSLMQAQNAANERPSQEPAILKRDFFRSLCAAFSIDEVFEQVYDTGLEYLNVSKVGTRHWMAYGTKGGQQ